MQQIYPVCYESGYTLIGQKVSAITHVDEEMSQQEMKIEAAVAGVK